MNFNREKRSYIDNYLIFCTTWLQPLTFSTLEMFNLWVPFSKVSTESQFDLGAYMRTSLRFRHLSHLGLKILSTATHKYLLKFQALGTFEHFSLYNYSERVQGWLGNVILNSLY